jgi:UDP-glucose 4-epimerase
MLRVLRKTKVLLSLIMENFILITGGLGYIGSHIADKLLEDYKHVIIIDNKENSSLSDRWSNHIKQGRLKLLILDISSPLDAPLDVLDQYNIIGVIHCAALKSVPESMKEPLKYYKNNINTMIRLLEYMNKRNIKTFIFSSSATVYSGNNTKSVFCENDVSFPTTPYGNTKIVGEKMLEDLYQSDNSWKIISLRYFNPAVCYLNVNQGDTGLFTAIEKVIKKTLPYLAIFGDDYETPDGSCIRDYIHIKDLVDAHVSALDLLLKKESGSYDAINIGTGVGCSTLQIAKEFQNLDDQFQYQILPRRLGDAPVSIANCDKAKHIVQWSSKYSLHDICKDIYYNISAHF